MCMHYCRDGYYIYKYTYLSQLYNHGSLQQTVVSTRSIVIENCDAKEDFDLTNCDASTIDDCTSNDLAWVQCIRSSMS